MTARRVAFVIVVISLLSCEAPPSSSSTDGSVSPTGPSAEFRPPPLALPGPGVTLSGRILEVARDGTRRPIGARQLHVEVDVSDVRDPNRGGWAPVEADGRYRVTGVLDGRFVKIAGVDIGRPSSYRFCATNTTIRGDTELDVSLFLPGAVVPTPILSGQVFRMIDGKPTPVRGVDMYYRSRGYGSDVIEYTDADGRYSMCGIPPMPGTLSMYCGNDVQAVNQAVDIRADQVIDIDVTTFYECLAIVTARTSTGQLWLWFTNSLRPLRSS